MRCYNGCPDSELQAILDAEAAAMRQLKRLCPAAHCTYHHPVMDYPSGFQVHEWGRPLTGFYSTKITALRAAIAVLLHSTPGGIQ